MIKQKLALLVAVSALLFGSASAAQRMQVLTDEDAGYLGVQIRDVTTDDLKELKLPREAGVVIEQVEPGSPAEKAGLAAKDVITDYSGVPVLSARQFRRLIQETPADRQVDVKVVRNGQSQAKSIRIGGRPAPQLGGGDRQFRFQVPQMPDDQFHFRMPPEFEGRAPGRRSIIENRPKLGINGVELTDQMAEFLGVSGKSGVLIMEVRKDTAAEKAGLRAGDVIVAVDGKTIDNVAELSESLTDGSRNLDIIRDKKKQSVRVTIESNRSESGEGPKRL